MKDEQVKFSTMIPKSLQTRVNEEAAKSGKKVYRIVTDALLAYFANTNKGKG